MRRKKFVILIAIMLVITIMILTLKLEVTELNPVEHLGEGEVTAEEWIRATVECSLESDETLLDTFDQYQEFMEYCGFENNEEYNKEFFSTNSLILYGTDANLGKGPVLIFDTLFDSKNKDTFRIIRYRDVLHQGSVTAQVIYRLYFIEVADKNIDNKNIELKFGLIGNQD